MSEQETATLYRCKTGHLVDKPCTIKAPMLSDLPDKPCSCTPETWRRAT